MKSEELRIGNLLNKEGFGLIKITGIHLNGIYATPFNHNRLKGEVFLTNRFEPIPLSEEFLLNFGFEKKVKKDSDSNLIVTYHLATPNAYFVFEDDWSLAIADDESGYEDGWDFLTFNEELTDKVHLLQNILYFLTGEELQYGNQDSNK